MSMMTPFAEDIPGFLKIALIVDGKAMNGKDVSLVWMDDDGTECLIGLTKGLDTGSERLTPRMKSWFTGMAEVGSYLAARHKTDEDGVTEDDIERAALTLAFPKLARDPKVLDMLKGHLDLLQAEGLVDELTFRTAPAGDDTPDEDPVAEDTAAVTADPEIVDQTPAPVLSQPDLPAQADDKPDAPAGKTDGPTLVEALASVLDAPTDKAPSDTPAPTVTAKPALAEPEAEEDEGEPEKAEPAPKPFVSRPDNGLTPRPTPYNAGYASPFAPRVVPAGDDKDAT